VHTYQSEKSLWRAVDRRLGARKPPVPPSTPKERAYCRLSGWVNDYTQEPDDAEEWTDHVVAQVVHLRAAGLSSALIEAVPLEPADGRWALLSELDAVGYSSELPWSAISVTTTYPVGFNLGGNPPRRSSVELTIDHQVSLRTLIRSLRKSWPRFYSTGMMRRSRPLGERSVALLRHVCLDSPLGTDSKTWLTTWNRKWPRRPAWRFNNVRELVTALHRSEAELTGSRHGLAWFYDPFARLTTDELNRLAKAGNTHARRVRDRRATTGLESLKRGGIQVRA
jgi:hypothetical protein